MHVNAWSMRLRVKHVPFSDVPFYLCRFPRIVRTRDRPRRVSDPPVGGSRSRKPKTGPDPAKPLRPREAPDGRIVRATGCQAATPPSDPIGGHAFSSTHSRAWRANWEPVLKSSFSRIRSR